MERLKRLFSPGLIVAVVAMVFALGGTAVADHLITGDQIARNTITGLNIQNESIRGGDIDDGSITARDLNPSTLRALHNGNLVQTPQESRPGTQGAQGPEGPQGPQGPQGERGPAGANGRDGVVSPQSAALGAPTPIVDIGGPINDRNTDLGVGLDLEPGTYLVTVDGAFQSGVAAGDPTVEVYPQLSLWLDHDGDNAFEWNAPQPEGDISPNAIMPKAANRHISVSGTTTITLNAPTRVGLVAFGYTSTQGSERSGEINVVRAVLTAIPVATPAP